MEYNNSYLMRIFYGYLRNNILYFVEKWLYLSKLGIELSHRCCFFSSINQCVLKRKERVVLERAFLDIYESIDSE
jgi:hypothetical protein